MLSRRLMIDFDACPHRKPLVLLPRSSTSWHGIWPSTRFSRACHLFRARETQTTTVIWEGPEVFNSRQARESSHTGSGREWAGGAASDVRGVPIQSVVFNFSCSGGIHVDVPFKSVLSTFTNANDRHHWSVTSIIWLSAWTEGHWLIRKNGAGAGINFEKLPGWNLRDLESGNCVMWYNVQVHYGQSLTYAAEFVQTCTFLNWIIFEYLLSGMRFHLLLSMLSYPKSKPECKHRVKLLRTGFKTWLSNRNRTRDRKSVV